MSTPIIGLTTYRHLSQYGYPQHSVSEAYIRALISAGSCPVMIPLDVPNDSLSGLASRLDGVLFTGGGDVHPVRYGSQTHPLVSDVDEDRDRLEIELLYQIQLMKKPFLGICRGLQVINVALGGTLYEDIADQHPDAIQHRYFPNWPREHLAHEIQVEEHSHLGKILGTTRLMVNSLHHQGIRRPAQNLQVCAYAPDGIIEAYELPDYPYGLAVQWHPENLQAHMPMQALFQSFVSACTQE